MRAMMILLLAALPPAAMWAQNRTQAGQGAKTPSGARYCGHLMDAGTFIDARSKNASGDEALVIRWLDPKGTDVHTALFMGRCIAKDGDVIDSKAIARVLPNSLAVSNRHALTAWEAEYSNLPHELAGGSAPRRGVFSDNHFVAELDPSKVSEPGSEGGAEADFRWDEEFEILKTKPGVVLVPPTPNYTYTPIPASNNAQPPSTQPAPAQAPMSASKPCTPQTQQGPNVKVHPPKKASAWACQHIGICADDKPVDLTGGNGCPAAPASGQPAK